MMMVVVGVPGIVVLMLATVVMVVVMVHVQVLMLVMLVLLLLLMGMTMTRLLDAVIVRTGCCVDSTCCNGVGRCGRGGGLLIHA